MSDIVKHSERIRSLSVIIGTAFQRSLLRFSNLLLLGLCFLSMLVLPSAIILPVVVSGLFLIGGNVFLGATDYAMLDSLLKEFSLDSLPNAMKLPALLSDGKDSFSEAAKGKLKGVHRELFQKLVKSRKELDRYMSDHKVQLPGEIAADLTAKLDTLTDTFRVLAFRGCLLADFLSKHPYKTLMKEAEGLEKKSEEATSDQASADYMQAAKGKRDYADKLSIVSTKVEDIEAKLHHIISTVEGYTVHLATSATSISDDEMVEQVEETVGALKAEAESLEEIMKIIA